MLSCILPTGLECGTQNGQVKLGDFSLCKYDPNAPSAEDHYWVTVNMTQQQPLGMMLYSSPEHLKNMAEVSIKTDIWAWGVVAYELLTGNSPFKRNTARQGLQAIMTEHPDFKGIPELWHDAIAGCMEKEEKNRTITAYDLVEGLERILYPS